MSTKIFWLEPLDRERRWLRRYRSSSEHTCAKDGSYCNARVLFDEVDIKWTKEGYIASTDGDAPPQTDPRWPTHCEKCGEAFVADDPYQLFARRLFVRVDTKEVMTPEEAPPGAVWEAWYLSERDKPNGVGWMRGPDGRSLIAKCPDGREWMIDSRARNCTLPDDNTHHCWCRHGKPEDGTLHVDKAGYPTCAAGAGSIDTGTYHGFLHNGAFT